MKLRDIEFAVEFLGLPRQSVYELCRTNSIPHVKIGTRRIRFIEAELIEWARRGGSKSKQVEQKEEQPA